MFLVQIMQLATTALITGGRGWSVLFTSPLNYCETGYTLLYPSFFQQTSVNFYRNKLPHTPKDEIYFIGFEMQCRAVCIISACTVPVIV